ncbi:MAG: divalent-cation tolerance protein CutA [Cyanobacteria bacterium NC_groundwater_1444_Ag_S-0.65um_54_12]|nr:divalent-cation tolerance protein CutA [Cyanobacteria bacterium NC_groundwater_1444_Ag_S-0.65um_54_12]
MRICLSTLPVDCAERIATTLLAERLVACVNLLGPLESRYWWDGAIQTDQEIMLLLKTHDDLTTRLIERLRELHPYEVPEIVIIPVEFVSPPYLAWVDAQTLPARG